MMENKFSSKYEESNSNIEKRLNKSAKTNNEVIEFIAFLETNKEFFKKNILGFTASTRINALSDLIEEVSSYSLEKYLSNKDVRYYLFKNRFFTKTQYANLSILVCTLSFVIFFILSIIFFRNHDAIRELISAGAAVSILFYIFDGFEWIF